MRLLITRPEPDASLTAEKLVALGHDPVIAPVMETVFADGLEIGSADVLVATSRNGVRALNLLGDAPLKKMPLFMVGRASAELASEFGFEKVHSADGNVDDLIDLLVSHFEGSSDKPHLLYAAGRDRKGDFEGKAQRAGFPVSLQEAYRAEKIPTWSTQAIDSLKSNKIDGVLHYSARTAELFFSILEENDISQTTNLLPHFCLANAVANVFDGAKQWKASEKQQVFVAARPNEAELFNLIEQYS